jgi:murein DD-endopeptidase MepM/ murein hydrolase activator NlpD
MTPSRRHRRAACRRTAARQSPARTNPVTHGTAVGGPTDPTITGAVSPGGASFDPRDRIAELDAAADILERGQRAALDTLALAVENRADQLGTALAALGYTPNIGGPLVPVEPGHADFARVAGDLDALADMQAFAQTLPLGGPLAVIDVTSGYGTRRDPFLGQTAMHTGVDLAAASGTPVRATGPGEVTIAGANGGYGNMVEIDHGNGITTKYGHLSTIAVEVGEVAATGAMIGRSGSTGRSTGPHLHYEITRDGRTIDPMAHIRTGPQIVAMLRP